MNMKHVCLRSSGKGAAYLRIHFTHRLSAEMATISDDCFQLESCVHLETSYE